MPIETLKGTEDSPPQRQIQLNQVIDTLRTRFERYGFRPFDTPMIEYIETLTMKYDEDAEILQEIFSLKDRGERHLGLRYDLTIPLCRYIATQKQLKLPFRRYHVGKVFRDGPVKPGRLREFIQCDADVVGLGGQEIEAELLSLFAECYQALGIHAIIEINNNKILRGALLQQGFEERDLDSLILSIDKLKKIGEYGVLDEIEDKGFSRQEAADALQLVQMEQVEELEPLATQQELIEGIQELRSLRDMLEKLNVPYRVNLSMARGLNYYTGNIWEAYERNETITSSIGSGGRYDKGIGNYVEDGNSYPAVGISFGIIPILACMDHSQQNGVSDVVVVPLERGVLGQAFAVAQQLHAEDMNAELYYGYKLKKAFEYADYLGARYLAIIGEKDCSEGVYTLRDLSTKEEWKKALPEFHENL